jgi:hypothetical protein
MMTLYWKYTLQLNQQKDAKIITYLDRQMNKADCIRRALIRQMEREGYGDEKRRER